MRSLLPTVGTTHLEEHFVNDLISMWSEKNQLTEWSVNTLRRQLTNLQYDDETIRTWKNLLAQWKG